MTFILTDSASRSGEVCRLYEAPDDIIAAERPQDVAAAISRLDAALADGRHAAGFFSYELGYVLEPRLAPLLPQQRNVPLLWFGLFNAPRLMTRDEAGQWLAQQSAGGHELSPVRPLVDEGDYLQTFAKVQEKISAGDIYQMNLTFKAGFDFSGCPVSLYRELRAKQPTDFGALIATDDFSVLSVSPELFVQQKGRSIETRPMKGTQSRGRSVADDAAARARLSADAKQRAENLMIVDLMRNDLGRISEIGSVGVRDLFAVETYPTLHQMTTTVAALLRTDVDLAGLLGALFPPGSITGAPKIRAMELIADYEGHARGVYCGGVGHMTPDGDALFNVAIRTAVIFPDGKGEVGIGSGVVADSDGAKEYAECLLKLRFFTDPAVTDAAVGPGGYQLIETMLYEGARGFWLLDEHMARLAFSAERLGFAFDEAAARRALDAAVSGQAKKRLRVRALLHVDGRFEVETTPQPEGDAGDRVRFVVSPTRLDPDERFLFHKTTRRQLYDDEHAHYARTAGADEVVYVNIRGELTEGSRTTLFVERGGKLLTPALECGLLPGTLRAHLLASGKADEAVLRLAGLETAEAIYLGNSVRGLQRAQMIKGA